MRTIFTIAFVAAVATAPLRAEPVAATATVTVKASDLGAAGGMDRLRTRLGRAIEGLCGSYATIESYQIAELDACRAAAWKSVEPRLATLKRGDRIQLSAR